MKREYIPIVIMGSLGVILIGVGFYFRKQIKESTSAALDYIFTDNITYHLNQLNPAVRKKFADFVAKVQSMGYKPQINSSYRSFAKQADIKKNEDPNAATPGYSAHNYGIGIDMQVSKNGKTYGKSTSDAEWLSTGIPQLAKSLGMRWGGTDFGTGYQDAVHFDLMTMPPATLLALAQKQFGTTDPNKIIGNQLNIT